MMGSNLVYCSLEVLTPPTPLTTKLLEPVNNKGIELYFGTYSVVVKDTDNGWVYTLNCNIENNPESTPFKLCKNLDNASETCHASLLLEDVEESIKQCRFHFCRSETPI